MTARNVLVFPAGTEIGLEISNALRLCKEISLFGAGQDISNHARFSYSDYHLPAVHQVGWVEKLASLCEKLSIDYVFPAHDDVILALSRVTARIPAIIISPPAKACEITRSKSETYRTLSNVVRVPRLYSTDTEIECYPVLVKPDRGQGSAGITLVSNPADLTHALAGIAQPIISEYLPGDEYTVDCFSDRELGLLFAGARQRRRTRNGISVNTITVSLPEIEKTAREISSKLEMRGAWFFQVKRARNNELALLEVGPRIAGSMAAHRVKGINFPLLSIFECERLPLTLNIRSTAVELDRALSNRYRHQIVFSALYVDLDDTLILNGQVNLEVIKLIYQSINRGVKIILLTRHADDIKLTLAKYRLNSLFDEVIHLSGGEPKSALIKEPNAILVDDSYAERMEVFEALGIDTFDCSMIEILTLQAEDMTATFWTGE